MRKKPVMKKPLILIPCNLIDYNGSPGHIARDTYIQAVLDITGGVPLLLPAAGRKVSFADVADHIDGIVLTGSPSHVAPVCYGAQQIFEDKELDLARDATTLPMIQQALERDIPLLAICRGFQELNVVTGGSLHQRVHEVDGKMDHRPSDALKAQGIMAVYRHQAHEVETLPGGLLARWNAPSRFTVNTVHQQGVDKLGAGLHVEAIAPDGLIEAISLPSKRFVFGTQWHPEGDPEINPVSRLIFEKFGEAVHG
jgi:putative glutamine amidotransferase